MADDLTPDIAERPDPRPGHGGPFVPDDFTAPTTLPCEGFWLEPLGPQHNEADYEAWSTSIDHIRATPGFPNGTWPHPMTLEENLSDLVMHARHFAHRAGFTYTVRSSSDDDVIGCVYIYPHSDPDRDAQVRSWVRASHAHLDRELWQTVTRWLAETWPFDVDRVDYAARR